jgi:hypothetical protein
MRAAAADLEFEQAAATVLLMRHVRVFDDGALH